MSDQPNDDKKIYDQMARQYGHWRTGNREPAPDPQRRHEEYWREIDKPAPSRSWEDYCPRAYALMAGAGLDPKRCHREDWPTMVEILARAMAWDMPHGYILAGSTGNGKSTLLRLIKRHGFAGRGEFGWRYREATAMRDELVSAGGAAIEEPSWSARCLLIDDLGTEKPANIYGVKTEAMHEIIDARWNWHERGGRTIIAANLRAEEIQPRYGERAWSRIRGMCRVVKLETPDQRRVTE